MHIFTKIVDTPDLKDQIDKFVARVKAEGYTHFDETDDDAQRALSLLREARRRLAELPQGDATTHGNIVI